MTTYPLLPSTRRSVDQQATRGVQSDLGGTANRGPTARGVTLSLKVTVVNLTLVSPQRASRMKIPSLTTPISMGIALAIMAFPAPNSALAGTYEAKCGNAECVITLSDLEIVTPYGVIPTSRVANWGGSGSTNTDLILGAAATYLLGPAGLVGFLAKTHEYNYAITGYDRDGNRTSVQIRFLNSKPANAFVQEMLVVTGLGMGQTRTATQIKELEKRIAEERVGSVRNLRKNTLNEDYRAEGGIDQGDSLGTASRTCWSEYLRRNPQIVDWVNAHKEAASKVKAKYRNC